MEALQDCLGDGDLAADEHAQHLHAPSNPPEKGNVASRSRDAGDDQAGKDAS